MPSGPITSIGIIGAGKLGTVVARLAIKAGYTVYISGSGDPKKIELSIKYITPGAHAVTTSEAIRKSDAVILALPLGKYHTLPVGELAGKLVIDAMNYWWEIDGDDPTIASASSSSSEAVQAFLKDSRVIKAISHMGYHHLFDEAKPRNADSRKAIAIAGDNSDDNNTVSHLIDDLGFDPAIIGPLANGKVLEPGNELFGANIGEQELRAIVAKNL